MKDELELLESLSEGSEYAYKYLYDNYYSLLCHIAYEYVKDDFLSESLVGDVFFNIYEKRESLKIEKTLQAYLIRSVKNRCLNYLNESCVRRECCMDITTRNKVFETLSDSSSQPLSDLLEKELKCKIEGLLLKLPKETYRVFSLSRDRGMSYEEIAEELNISVNTVKYHIKKALAYLKEHLQEYMVIWFCFYFSICPNLI